MTGEPGHRGSETVLDPRPGKGPSSTETSPDPSAGVDLSAPSLPSLASRMRSLPPRRVLVFGKSRKRSRQTSGKVEAFEAQGCRVEWINLARLRRRHGRKRAPEVAWRAFQRFAPDLVFTTFPDLPLELMKRIGETTPVAQWCEQVLDPLTEEHVQLLAQSDFPLITNPVYVTALEKRGYRHAVPALEGFSRTWHHRVPARKVVRDVAFLGGPGRNKQRADFLFQLAERHGITVFGRGWDKLGSLPPGLRIEKPVATKGFRRVCTESRIVLGLNDTNEDPGYWSDRTVLSLACGAFHLTHYVPGLEEVFEDGKHLAWYRDLEECDQKIRHYLDHPEERVRVADAGHDLVHLRHRWHDRVADIFRLIRTRTELSGQRESPTD